MFSLSCRELVEAQGPVGKGDLLAVLTSQRTPKLDVTLVSIGVLVMHVRSGFRVLTCPPFDWLVYPSAFIPLAGRPPPLARPGPQLSRHHLSRGGRHEPFRLSAGCLVPG